MAKDTLQAALNKRSKVRGRSSRWWWTCWLPRSCRCPPSRDLRRRRWWQSRHSLSRLRCCWWNRSGPDIPAAARCRWILEIFSAAESQGSQYLSWWLCASEQVSRLQRGPAAAEDRCWAPAQGRLAGKQVAGCRLQVAGCPQTHGCIQLNFTTIAWFVVGFLPNKSSYLFTLFSVCLWRGLFLIASGKVFGSRLKRIFLKLLFALKAKAKSLASHHTACVTPLREGFLFILCCLR